MKTIPHPRLALVAGAAALAGCVAIPTGPSVMVLPGSRKSLEQFHADDAGCRDYAQVAIGGPNAGQAAANAAAANTVAGTAIGAAAGAIIGSASGQAGAGAAIGAGTGLIFGSAAAGNATGYSYYGLQWNYDMAYVQCMYAHGNQVPGRMVQRASNTYPAPPANYPPPGSYPPPGTPPPGSAPPPQPTPAPGG